MAHTKEFEEFLSAFPKGQLFRIIDPAGKYWSRDYLEFGAKWKATVFNAERAEDEIKIAARYTIFDPMKVMLEPAPPGSRLLI